MRMLQHRAIQCGTLALVAVPTLGLAGAMASLQVANPGFEETDCGAPAYWEARTPTDASRSLDLDPAGGRGDGAAARIHNRAHVHSRWRTGHLGDLAPAPGSPAEASAWVRTRIAGGAAYLTLYCMTAEGRIAAQVSSDRVAGVRGWTPLGIRTTVPESCAYVMLYLECDGEGTAWFDDVGLHGSPGVPPGVRSVPPTVLVPEDFRQREGYRSETRGRVPVLGLLPEAVRGRAEAVFWGPTARYEVTLGVLDERDGAGRLTLLVNGSAVGSVVLDRTPADHPVEDVVRECVFEGIDLQRRSRMAVEAVRDGGEGMRLVRVSCRPVGRFGGQLLAEAALRLPDSLVVFPDPAEARAVRQQYTAAAEAMAEARRRQREERLAGLHSPEQWRAYLAEIRQRLPEILGEYGPPCPLELRPTGIVEGPGYRIEKLIFQSQPGYLVTANLYLPTPPDGEPGRRRPGVLFTCGHAAAGKAYHLYHECCLGLVLKGCVVLAIDPTGQGERSEYVDPATGKDLVPRCVPQHHYAGRPSWLVGRCLAGYRTWDCIRALDVLLQRPEVDPQRIAAVGNSGGGQMALLITAVDERVAVCAAGHPGGSMENTYLCGGTLVDREVLSLIAPRPCLFVVGEKSGEAHHEVRCRDMQRFYAGLGVPEERLRHQWVDGVHDLKQPKREAIYAWLSRWFQLEGVPVEEPPLEPLPEERLHCTETGCVQTSLGGATIRSLNADAAKRLRRAHPLPPAEAGTAAAAAVRAAAERGFGLVPERPAPVLLERGGYVQDGVRVRKVAILAGDRTVPAALLSPEPAVGAALRPVVLVSERGKPSGLEQPSLALRLVRLGVPVLCADVAGSGEGDPLADRALPSLRLYDAARFRVEAAAVAYAYGSSTALAWQALDAGTAVDALVTMVPSAGDSGAALVGEGLGGVWALLAGCRHDRVSGVACVGMLPSFVDLVEADSYEGWGYCWVRGALEHADLADLPAALAPRPVCVLNPTDPTGTGLPAAAAAARFAWSAAVFRSLGAAGEFAVRAEIESKERIAEIIRDRLCR
ncbi:MAG: acetylxylan esterase [Lentisphaeria bacterium]|nr:acetylxylan esterase [Lentisphaeria bacterium]